MTNSKTTKRALLSSTLALLMCVAMLIGTTFAWFTDTASTAVNTIQSGTLKVDLLDAEGNSLEGQTLDFETAGDATEILWEPGCTYNLPDVYVKNNGNLALKYTVKITGIRGDAKLNEAIEWTIANVGDGHLEAGEVTSEPISISGHMREDAGNEYQGLTIEGIAITVFATQYTHESDSYDNQYDAEAQLPSIWDGTTLETPEAIDGVYHITNAAEFAAYINAVGGANASQYTTANAVLDCDIDLADNTITRTGAAYIFAGQFDGQGHTVSNFTIERTDDALYTSLFGYLGSTNGYTASVKDLTVENATVKGAAQTAAIAPGVYGGASVVNCHAVNCTVVGEKKVAAVVGYNEHGIVNDCTATDCNIYASDERANQAGAVLAYNAGTSNVTAADAVRVNVYTGVTTVSTAAELITAISNIGLNESANIVLMKDIDANNAWETIAVSQRSLTLDGNGHTIKNLNKPFLNLYGGTFKINNLTVEDSVVTANSDNLGAGVIVDVAQWANLYMDNCHVKNCELTGGNTRAAALVGVIYGGGEVTNCSVENCDIAVNGSIGAVIGHDQRQDGYVNSMTVSNCTAKNNTLTAVDDSWRVGEIIGTVGGANTAINNCTVSGNVLSQSYESAPIAQPSHSSLYGRIANTGTTLTIDGISQ